MFLLSFSVQQTTYRIGNHVYILLGMVHHHHHHHPICCLRENISFDTLIKDAPAGVTTVERPHTLPTAAHALYFYYIFIARRVQPSLPSSTLKSNFVYPRQISRSPRVGHCMS